MEKVFIFSLILMSNMLAMSDVGAFDVRISGDRLTIHAEQIPLQDILKRMVKQGVLVRIDPTLNPLISASFENRDIQEALSSILKPVAYVLTWEAGNGLPGIDSRLIEIQIFKRDVHLRIGHQMNGFAQQGSRDRLKLTFFEV